MAQKRMLIDALHPEETRVAVLDGNRLEDIDVEAASRRQLKGNIYLAKVTRVEPSLQAAFVDYGGNRHGFLAFNEIHPDYYQIPVADREALVAEHNADEREDEAKRLAELEALNGDENDDEPIAAVETIGGDDSEEVEVRRASPLRRHYKIQEVIKRRQILLVQVVKEERGNKGAAMTTYLSLAGRYCVLMPNTARGGGISRKIPAGKDRKRLKTILSDLGIPDGMGVIVRTAGAGRSKAEIRRDYEYLMRLWDNVRQLTLESIAPVLVYEEGNLIKRSIRDLYNREIDEIIVEGDDGYKTARNFMKLMIPSHVKRVQRYQDEEMPLFHRYQVDSQQDAMHSPIVRLKSGGYIVINPTEALVSIDVNSGRSTRERNIEETALKTNLEACDEVSRQLRLRDLAGLIVIDLIDMEVSRNRVQVERRLKDAMRNDRARIQMGRISPFGLMEMSRQRLRPSVLETSFETCEHCGGAGLRRSTQSTALHMLRVIEEEGIKRRSREVTFHIPTHIALYLLNHKRDSLASMEARYEVKIVLAADDVLIPPDFRIERIKVRDPEDRPDVPVHAESVPGPSIESPDEEKDEGEEGTKKRRRRRSRRRKRGDETENGATVTDDTAAQPVDDDSAEPESADEQSGERAEAGDADGNDKPA
ncbi:MAG: ribonuclease E/G, partial [Alphaproteobacteria bacterium]|nr:ribonuclease E/G [Alphaproteobacteria bacterium]